MKIALCSYDQFQGNSTGVYPPIHLCNLATSLQKAGYDVKVFDYASPFSKIDKYFKEIQDFRPALVGLTCYTPSLASFHKITKELRSYVPSTVMVVGGAHPSVWPKRALESLPQFDYAMQGECDRSIVALAEMISGKKSEEDVPGLVFRRDKEIMVNRAEIMKDLDQLPQVDRSFLDKYYKKGMYWDMAAKNPLDMMITSRGCPYDCSFCFKVEREYRFRNVDHVMLEFEDLKRRGVKSIHIQDDAFTVHKKRCIKILDELIKGNFKFELKVRSRVNIITEELLRKLKEAGTKRIIYGFESGSQKMLDSMNKKTTVEQNKKAIDLTKKVGITCYGEIMIGMPGETRETINETIDFLLEKKPIIGFIPVLYPLPGTKVYDEAKVNGTLRGDWNPDRSWPLPWVQLPWTQSYLDLYAESQRISKTVQRDAGTIFYFLKHHIGTMRWNQIKFLMKLAKQHVFS